MSVANTTGRLATPTTTSNIFAAAGGGPTPLKSVSGENNMGVDVNQVHNILMLYDFHKDLQISPKRV